MENLIEIGTLGRPHGVEGEINARLTIDVPTFESLCDSEELFIFVYIEGLPVPMKVEGWREKGPEGILLKLKRFDTREDAFKLTGSLFAVEESLLGEEAMFSPSHFVGFQIYTLSHRYIGRVVRVDDSTANILFAVETEDGKEILVPVADELVQEVDAVNRIIELSIPDGILDL